MNDFGGSFQNIHYGDILIKYGEILDFNKCPVPYLNSFISKTYKTVQNGDIIIADTAEDETVGKCVEIYNNSKANYWINEAEKYFHKDKESNYDFAVFLIGRNDDYFIY